MAGSRGELTAIMLILDWKWTSALNKGRPEMLSSSSCFHVNLCAIHKDVCVTGFSLLWMWQQADSSRIKKKKKDVFPIRVSLKYRMNSELKVKLRQNSFMHREWTRTALHAFWVGFVFVFLLAHFLGWVHSLHLQSPACPSNCLAWQVDFQYAVFH